MVPSHSEVKLLDVTVIQYETCMCEPAQSTVCLWINCAGKASGDYMHVKLNAEIRSPQNWHKN